LYDAKLSAALSLVRKICALEPDPSTGCNPSHKSTIKLWIAFYKLLEPIITKRTIISL
jgi:hypothetical protein